MNNTRKCFLILTIVFLLVGLGTLAASDVTTNDTGVSKTTETSNAKIVNKDTNTVSKSLKTEDIVTDTINEKNKNIKKNNLQKIRKTSEEIHVENYNNLTDALDKDAESVNIFIENDITLEDYLQVSDKIKNLSIDGNCFTINGAENQFLYMEHTCNVTLTNLNVKNCSAWDGGVISSMGNLTVENCNLTNNYVAGSGGVIHHYGNLTISNSNISSNTAGNGGAISYHNIESDDCMKITGSTFFNNTADNLEQERLGGAIFIEKNLEFDYEPSAIISDTKFIANNADVGGAIYSEGGNISIKDSQFKENNATKGGAIKHNGNLTITNTDMINNTAKDFGGAIFYSTDQEENYMIISDSKFINNSFNLEENLFYGGAIYMELYGSNPISITNTKFIANNATVGGAISSSGGNLTIKDSEFKQNNAEYGGAISHYGTLSITNTNMTDNTAKYSGGAIDYTTDEESVCYMIISDSNFINNGVGSEDDSGEGGAISIYADEIEEEFPIKFVSIANTKFIANNAEYGGAISSLGVNLTIKDSEFKQNNATYGGAIDYTGNLTITNTNMTDNNATFYGGAIRNILDYEESILNITDSEFINNRVTEDDPSDAVGGAIYMGPEEFTPGLNSSAFITNTKFIKNCALTGGAIYMIGENLYIQDNTFENNTAEVGGAIVTTANLTVNNTNMTDNTASNSGGAIVFMSQLTDLNIFDSTFTRNRAEGSGEEALGIGGAIYYHELLISVADTAENIPLNPVTIMNSKFIENQAVNGGAIYKNSPRNLTITNTALTGNSAEDTGGAVYINGTVKILLENTNMTENSAKRSGILYASENSNITIEGGTLKGNHAENTLLSSNKTDSLKISDSNFIDNYVTDNNGYVVDLQNINDIKIVDTKFDNNTDNKRDMLFSDAKEDASVDIHGNNYTNNYLSVNLTKLSDFDARNLDNKTLTFPVNITARKIYNHTINTGNLYFKTDLINNSNPVKNGQSTITLDNKKLQNNTNKVNYNYTSIQKHYQNANNTFNILKEMKESKINEIIIDPTRDPTEIIVKVTEDGQEINNAPIKITLPDGKTIETTSNKKIELDLPVGENKITIEYPGDITIKPETKSVTITVTPTPTTSTIKIENPTAGNVKVTGTVKDKNGKNVNEGTVTIKDNDKVLGTANIKNGVYTTTVNINTKGQHTIYVEYNPTKNYTTSSNNTQVNIKARNPVIKLNPVRGIIGENITLTAYLTDANGTPINGGNLAFKLNGKTLRTDGRFDSNATAMKFKVRNGIVTYTIKADLYMRNAKNLTASYSGNSMYQEITSPTVEAQIQRRTAQITVQVTPSKQKQYETVTITATLKDTTKNTKDTTLIHQNSKVMLKINGKTLKDTNNNTLYVNVGQDNKAVYTYTIPAGTGGIKNGTLIDYKTEAILVNDNYYPSVRNSTKFNIEQSSTTLAIKEAKVDKNNILSVKATLTDYKGNNLVGTNKISIKINGITLKNETGDAQVWTATNGVIDLTGIQVDKNTTIKRVMIVSSERQAYSEARMETTNIIRV